MSSRTYQASRNFETGIKFRLFFLRKIFLIAIVSYFSLFAILLVGTQQVNRQEMSTIQQGAVKAVVTCFKKHIPMIKGSASDADRELVYEFRKIVKSKAILPLYLALFGLLIPIGYFYAMRKKENPNRSNENRAIKTYQQSSKDKNGIVIGGYRKDENILIDKDKQSTNKEEEKSYRKNSIVINKEDETSHFFILGQSGTGKTVLTDQIVEQLKDKEQKMIIHDNKMGFTEKFYNPRNDYIFNSLDERSLRWNIFNDIDSIIDIESIASSLISIPADNADPFWNNSAKTILVESLKYCVENNLRTNIQLCEILDLPRKELIQKLDSNAATKLLEAEKQAASILSTLNQYTRSLEYLQDGDFSVKNWIKSDVNNSIFITNRKDISDIIAPLLTLFIDLAAKQLLSLDENLDRRVYFVLEELGMLNKLSSVVDLVTNGRSKGASVLVSMQDLAKLDEIYGREFNTIFGSCSTKILFRIGDNFTAQYIRNYAGQEEITRTDESISLAEGSVDGSLHVRKHIVNDDILKVAKLTTLPDRVFLAKAKSFNKFLELKTYVKKYEKYNNGFQERSI